MVEHHVPQQTFLSGQCKYIYFLCVETSVANIPFNRVPINVRIRVCVNEATSIGNAGRNRWLVRLRVAICLRCGARTLVFHQLDTVGLYCHVEYVFP